MHSEYANENLHNVKSSLVRINMIIFDRKQKKYKIDSDYGHISLQLFTHSRDTSCWEQILLTTGNILNAG